MSPTSPNAAVSAVTRCPGAERILTAARPLLAERGLSGVSIQQIADAAEVSKANVFHHFATKQALYRAALETASNEFGEPRSALSRQTDAATLALTLPARFQGDIAHGDIAQGDIAQGDIARFSGSGSVPGKARCASNGVPFSSNATRSGALNPALSP